MRIGVVTQWAFPASPDYRCRKIMEALIDGGHELTVFTAQATAATFSAGGRTVPVKALAGDSALAAAVPGDPRWTFWLIEQGRRLRLNWMLSKELRLGLATRWAARALGARFWLDLSENYPGMVRSERAGQLLMPLHAAVAAFLEKRCARAADFVTVVTESNRERLEQMGVLNARIAVVSNTPELQPLPPRSPAPMPERLNLVYAGMLSKVRGLEGLLKALEQCNGARSSICLHIVGDGSEAAALRKLAGSLGLADCVQFHGWVPREELPSWFVRCDVGVIPHVLTEFTHTTVPNKLFDYMACGLPVWTTSMQPCREIIDSVRCGWTSDDTIEGMVQVLGALLLTSAEERRARGERGRQAVLSSYNWSRDSRRMLESLARLS